jgi:hypothetical protein
MTDADAKRIEEKLDLIIDALGLGKSPRMAPMQRREFVKAEILKFQEKRRKKHDHDDKEGTRRGL